MKKTYLTIATLITTGLIATLPAHAYKATTSSAAKPAKSAKAPTTTRLTEIAGEIEKFTSIENDDERNFVLGYADLKQGRFNEADSYFRQVKSIGKLNDYLYFFRAEIALKEKEYKRAAEFSGEIISNYPQSALMSEAVLQKAEALIGLARYKEASTMLDDRRHVMTPDLRRRADEMMALALAKGGEPNAVSFVNSLALGSACEDDIKRLKPVFDAVKKSFDVDVEKWLNETDQSLALANSFFESSQHDDAARRLEGVLASGKLSGGEELRAKWTLSRCYRWMHRYDESIKLMEELRSSRGCPVSENALLGSLATVYAKKNEYEKAIAVRREMLRGSKGSAAIAEKIAFLYMDEGRYDEAISEFKKVIAMKGGEGRAMARWNLAWCYYMQENYDDAIRELVALNSSGAGKIADRVAYWKARILEKKGDEGSAREIFSTLASTKPSGYYGYLANKRLNGKNGDGNFLDSPYKKVGVKPFRPKLGSSDMPLNLSKAAALDRLGLNDEASRELRALSSADCARYADEVMYLASRNYAHDVAFRIVSAIHSSELKGSPAHLQPRELFIWEQSYPEAWKRNTAYETARRGVEPALALAIMRSESNFRPKVVSPAGAVGLMQIMPFTAMKLMKASGTDGSLWDLYKPQVNIALGVLYLRQLRDMFDGNPAAIIASYNAGEEAVARWLGNGRKIEIEEWIEEIPYAETNLYVKKVMAAYWTYKTIYGR